MPVIGVAGLFPYCEEEEAVEEGGGETRPLKAFTSCGGPMGVVGGFTTVAVVVFPPPPPPPPPSLFVMAAGALFNRLMMVELLLLEVLGAPPVAAAAVVAVRTFPIGVPATAAIGSGD